MNQILVEKICENHLTLRIRLQNYIIAICGIEILIAFYLHRVVESDLAVPKHNECTQLNREHISLMNSAADEPITRTKHQRTTYRALFVVCVDKYLTFSVK